MAVRAVTFSQNIKLVIQQSAKFTKWCTTCLGTVSIYKETKERVALFVTELKSKRFLRPDKKVWERNIKPHLVKLARVPSCRTYMSML